MAWPKMKNSTCLENSEPERITLELPSEQATELLGGVLADSLDEPMLIGLSGDLGAGKTTLTRGFLRYCGYRGAAKSPTFTLVESYEFGNSESAQKPKRRRPDIEGLHHFDLYRIADPEELDFIGFEDYLEGNFDVIVEWPELGGDRIIGVDFYVCLSHRPDARQARLEAHSPRARIWLKDALIENKFKHLRQ